MLIRTACVLVFTGTALQALADPPAGYYDSVTGTDAVSLQSQLNQLLNMAITRTYSQASTYLQDIDEDPNNISNVLLVYNGQSVLSNWDSGATWNREHTWPVSLGVGESGSDYSDLHHLHACNPGVNGARGNKQFGTLPGQWDPGQYSLAYRGRMARVAFYMKTRYPYLNMALLGNQQQFIDWHIAEMPNDVDNRRNDRVYNAQQNRNAFADHPEWAWALFGTALSDAQITIAGQGNVDGASSASVDLGLRIGQPSDFPAISIDLQKSGAAPTTYSVTTEGEIAEVSRYQFGAARNTQTMSHDVQFVGSNFGPFGGTVTIDTTEITTAGAGLGAGDGDDVVTITGLAIDHSLASLDSLSQASDILIDFGQLEVDETSPVLGYTIWNIALAPYSANLDIDSVMIIGDAGVFTTGIAPLAGILPGEAAGFNVEIDTQTIGTYEATAVVTVSDEDLPGAAEPVQLTVTFRGRIGACIADTNGDGILSPADFSAWIAAFNAGAPECDQNYDEVCSPADFSAWVANFNAGC
ncbi:MAG: endonuclease [Phycisphaerales bacterium]|nr:endonuclease [Phycisphaerales bacterium]MCB9837614.1 endonuclease [Phycisphaera sp.]